MISKLLGHSGVIALIGLLTIAAAIGVRAEARVSYKTVKVEGLDIFYREAGDKSKTAILLLHGFPASSHMFRELIPKLADKFYVVAPDYPAFGFSSAPDPAEFKYTFDHLAQVVDGFTKALGITKYAIYLQDYGSPVGFRLAIKNPDNVTALIVQNGNAYEEGLTEAAAPLKSYGKDRNKASEETLRGFMTLEGTKFQYVTGAKDPRQLSPDAWTFDQALLDRPGIKEIQLDLFADYLSNIQMYPAWHEYLKKNQPSALILWGKNDPFFNLKNIDGFRGDLRDPEIHILDGGHFVLEEQPDEIAAYIKQFMVKTMTGK
jgi:pimeloyl-ACP methyl ester carboxylesterase